MKLISVKNAVPIRRERAKKAETKLTATYIGSVIAEGAIKSVQVYCKPG
jgi:hypothetical protein